jgi:hypothetical protein
MTITQALIASLAGKNRQPELQWFSLMLGYPMIYGPQSKPVEFTAVRRSMQAALVIVRLPRRQRRAHGRLPQRTALLLTDCAQPIMRGRVWCLFGGRSRRGAAERAGRLDLGDAAFVEAQHIAQDFVGVFAKQR